MSMTAWICAIGAGLLNSCAPTISQRQGPQLARQLGMQMVTALLAACVCVGWLAASGAGIGGPEFLLIAAASGLCAAINGPTYYMAVVHRGPVSISWAVVWTAAVGVAILGWSVMREPLFASQAAGIVCFLASLAVMAAAMYRVNRLAGAVTPIRRGFAMFLGVSLLTGVAASFLMRFKDVAPAQGDHVSFILPRFLMMLILLGGLSGARRVRPVFDGRTWLTGALYAASVVGNMILVLIGLDHAPASVIFPMTAGVAIIGGVAVAQFRGERTSRLAWLGVALAVSSIVLINLKLGLLRAGA
ncbi:MAG: hypothetical protein BIFFINMI_03641 [Phycisphaerae bacterium]|nr:hypothetical protein [Phycisphaerae bacterium]